MWIIGHGPWCTRLSSPADLLYALSHRTLQQLWGANSNSFLRNKERGRITLLLVSHLEAKSFALQFCALSTSPCCLFWGNHVVFFLFSLPPPQGHIQWSLMKFWSLWKEMAQNTSPGTTDYEPQFSLCLPPLSTHTGKCVCPTHLQSFSTSQIISLNSSFHSKPWKRHRQWL